MVRSRPHLPHGAKRGTPGHRALWSARRACIALLGCLLIASASGNAAASATEQHDQAQGLRLLRSDAQAIELRYALPEHRLRPVRLDGQAFEALEIPGAGESAAAPGQPALPELSVLLGIPPTGEPLLEIELEGGRTIDRPLRLPPVPSPIEIDGEALALPESQAPIPGAQHRHIPDPAAYRDARSLPGRAARITEIGWIRHQRFLRLTLYPARYAAAAGELRLHGQIHVRIRFDAGGVALAGEGPVVEKASAGAPSSSLSQPDPLFDPLLDTALLNAESARRWRSRPTPDNALVDPPGPSEQDRIWNLHVEQAGMVRIEYAELAAAGLPLGSLDPRRFQLYERGQEIAIQVEGESDASFDLGDGLNFYGQAPDSRHANSRVYQLRIGQGPGRRMPVFDAAPRGGSVPASFRDSIVVERNERYVSDKPRPRRGDTGASGLDRWYWQQLSAPQQIADAQALPDMAGGEWIGDLRVAVVGKSRDYTVTPDHHLRAWMGGQALGDRYWDGDDEHLELSFPFSPSQAQGGLVDLRLEAGEGTPARYDQFYLDHYTLRYQRRFIARGGRLAIWLEDQGPTDLIVSGLAVQDARFYDLEDPQAPQILAAAQPLGDGLRFHSPGSGNRRLEALGDAGFLSPSRIEARPQTDLLDPGRGADYLIITPATLRDAIMPLAERRAAQGQRVEIVELQAVFDSLAGGNVDPEALRSFIRYALTAWQAPAPAALLLVGDASYDPLGHLPDSNPNLLPAYLKLSDPWLGEVASDNAYAAVIGDDLMADVALGRLPANSPAELSAMVDKILAYEDASSEGDWRKRIILAADRPDPAGDFHALSENIASDLIPAEYELQRIYYGGTHALRNDARDSIVSGFESGALLSQYIGHGRSLTWATDSILKRSDLSDLGNKPQLPIMLDMTCMTGRFHERRSAAIAEEAVRAPAGGAVAAFAPTGFGVATGHDIMNRAFVRGLLLEGTRQLGALTMASRLALYTQTGAHHDLLENYALLGDPLLEAALPLDGQATATPFLSPTPSPTATPTTTPSPIPTTMPDPSPSTSPTAPPSPSESVTPAPNPDPSPSSSPPAGSSPAPSPSATPSPDPQASPIPSASPSPSGSATPEPGISPTPVPGGSASPQPGEPTATAPGSASATPGSGATATAESDPTPGQATATPASSQEPTPTLEPGETPAPSSTPESGSSPSAEPGETALPNETPSPVPGATRSPEPGATPTALGPTPVGTAAPVSTPDGSATPPPSASASVPPPIASPTNAAEPTAVASPVILPTEQPSSTPAITTPPPSASSPAPPASLEPPRPTGSATAGAQPDAGLLHWYFPLVLQRRW